MLMERVARVMAVNDPILAPANHAFAAGIGVHARTFPTVQREEIPAMYSPVFCLQSSFAARQLSLQT